MPTLLLRLQRAIDVSPNPTLLVDEHGMIRSANEHAAALLETTLEELTTAAVERYVPEEHRAHHLKNRQTFLAAPVVRPMGQGRDLFALTEKGTRVPIEIGLHPAGEGLVLVSLVDIRERLRQRELFEVALDAAPAAILMVDHEGIIEVCNEQTLTTFGYERETLLGMSVDSLVPAAQRGAHAQHRGDFRRTPSNRSMGENRVLLARHASGRKFPVEVALRPVAMHGTFHVIATVVDVSASLARAEQLAATNRQLRELNEELEAMAYATSHDLRAPVASAIGLIECCLEDLDANQPQDVRSNLERIRTLNEQMSRTISGLREIAVAGNGPKNITEVSLEELVVDSVDAHSADVQGAEISIEASGRLRTEPARLRSIVDNLISNALRFRRVDGAHHVHIHANVAKDGATLSVADNGVGVPEDATDEIFRLFKRATHRPESSGVGLALVRKHLKHLGGRVEVEHLSPGVRFVIHLPYGDVDDR